jgi:hypothetical protein
VDEDDPGGIAPPCAWAYASSSAENSLDELKMLIFPVREYDMASELQHKRIKRSTTAPSGKSHPGIGEGSFPFPAMLLLFIHIFFINQMEHTPDDHETEHERRKQGS